MLNIRLLGGFQVSDNSRPIAGFESARLQSFLAYLLLHSDVAHTRQHLAFLFWPDSRESQARTNLRGLLLALRKSLPEPETFLEVDNKTIRWRAEADYRLDVDELSRSLAAAKSSAELKAAVDLYRGELLPGFYEDWILAERERLHARVVEGLSRLVAMLEEEGDLRSIERYARRLLREDPYKEENYRRLMRFYLRSGDRASALRAYQTCLEILRDDLGIEVSPDTEALYEQILRDEVSAAPTRGAPAPTRTDNLPIQLTRFIGRQGQIQQLQESIRKGRLLTLTGPGGSGKTRLALQAAGEAVDDFSDGVWLVELAQLSSPEEVSGAAASVLNVRDLPHRTLHEGLVEFLRSRSLLLVLDNCEHLLQACSKLVVTILQSCPQVRILATSRERLNVPGEQVHFVAALTVPEPGRDELAVIRETEAVQLFVERATAILSTFDLDQTNASAVAQICRRLDGIPLAIELAAAWARLIPPGEMVGMLDDIFRLLAGGSPVAPPRHQTLRAAMDWSYDLLSESERVLLRRLSIFSGGWTLKAAERVIPLADGSLAEADVLGNLARLIDKSLVLVDSQTGAARYRLLEAIRDYSRAKLEEAGETPRLHESHFHYFQELAASAGPRLNSPDQIAWLGLLEREHANLRAALRWALDSGQMERALLLEESLHHYWVDADRVSEGAEWIQRTLGQVDESLEPSLLARGLYCLGYLKYLQGEYDAANQQVERSRELFEELGDEEGIAQTILPQGTILWHQGHYAEAQREFERSLQLFQEVPSPTGSAEALHLLGHIFLDRGDHASAQTHFDESIQLFREHGSQTSVAALVGDLGLLAYLRREFTRARTHYEENLAFYQEAGNGDGIARTLNRLGDLDRCEGDYARAESHYEESLALARRIDLQAHRLSATHNLGYIALNGGNLDASGDRFEECLRAYGALEDQKGVAECLAGLGGVAAAAGKFEQAVRLISASQAQLEALGTEPWPANQMEIERSLTALKQKLDRTSFSDSWEAGKKLDLSGAVAEALETSP